jgi:hypothetical protein
LKADDRVSIKQLRRRIELIRVQPADIVVEQQDAPPPARAADQQAEVALPADVEGTF